MCKTSFTRPVFLKKNSDYNTRARFFFTSFRFSVCITAPILYLGFQRLNERKTWFILCMQYILKVCLVFRARSRNIPQAGNSFPVTTITKRALDKGCNVQCVCVSVFLYIFKITIKSLQRHYDLVALTF